MGWPGMEQEYGISVGREMGERVALALATQGQKGFLLQMRQRQVQQQILLVELQGLQGAAQVRQSSFANLDNHQSDRGWFLEVEGQRWSIELHPVPLQLSRIRDGTFSSQQCQLKMSLLLPGGHLCVEAPSQPCEEGIMYMFSCYRPNIPG